MKIDKVHIKNFMLFNSLEMQFSPNINIFLGENSTGKTALLKLLYSVTRSISDIKKRNGDFPKDKFEELVISKMCGVFKPDSDMIGRLAGRICGNTRSEVNLEFDTKSKINIGFGTRSARHIECRSKG